METKNSATQKVLLRFQPNLAKLREDLSAVVLTPGGNLWLACDETRTIERLCRIDEESFEVHESFNVEEFIDLPSEDPEEEIDIEGMEYADNYIWLVGSHSLKRAKIKDRRTDAENIRKIAEIKDEKNRYLLARIPLDGNQLSRSCVHPKNPGVELTAAKLENTEKGNLLTEVLAEDPHIAPFLASRIPSKENGFDIEGLTIYKDKIFLGLRGPVLRGWAIIIEIAVEESSPTTLKLKKIGDKEYKKHFVYLSGLGVRELCVDGEDLLILAGPTMDLDGPVRLYRLKNGVNLEQESISKPELIVEIPYSEGEDHAEGIALIETEGNQKSMLVVYDSPAKSRLQGEDGIFADLFSF